MHIFYSERMEQELEHINKKLEEVKAIVTEKPLNEMPKYGDGDQGRKLKSQTPHKPIPLWAQEDNPKR